MDGVRVQRDAEVGVCVCVLECARSQMCVCVGGGGGVCTGTVGSLPCSLHFVPMHAVQGGATRSRTVLTGRTTALAPRRLGDSLVRALAKALHGARVRRRNDAKTTTKTACT
jgi:hypothetical protein